MNIKMKSNRSKTAIKQRKEQKEQPKQKSHCRISALEYYLNRKLAVDYDDEYWSTRDGW